MTTVADILDVLEALAPTGMKMDWDNVGLLCGSRKKEVEQVLVALDPFEDVCDEAVEWGADVIVTHHPLIFRPVASVTDETSVGRIIERLCSAGICAVNAHTNLDCAPGGVNDELASSAIAEVGNIMCCSYINALSSLLGFKVEVSVPEVSRDMVGSLLSVPIIYFADHSDNLLLIEDRYFIDDQSIVSHVLFLPNLESLKRIFSAVGEPYGR